MGKILRHWRITLATVFALVLIVGSFLLARDAESPATVQASTESALLQAIAAKDSDSDGLPDWEEALYGTNPRMADSLSLGMSDGQAVAKGLIVPKAVADIPAATSTSGSYDGSGPPLPAEEGTLTASFAQTFFDLYIAAKQANGGADLSPADTADIATKAVATLSSSITAASDYKSAKDIKISDTGTLALATFAGNAEAIMNKNANGETTDEITYLRNAIEDGDADASKHLSAIAKVDRDTAVGLAALSVPQELVPDVLALVNALMRMSEIISDFSRVDTDPLAAMLALQQYLQTTQDLWQAYTNIGDSYIAAGVALSAGTPGASFIRFAESVAMRSRAAQTP